MCAYPLTENLVTEKRILSFARCVSILCSMNSVLVFLFFAVFPLTLRLPLFSIIPFVACFTFLFSAVANTWFGLGNEHRT